jgi:hypothetical protein
LDFNLILIVSRSAAVPEDQPGQTAHVAEEEHPWRVFIRISYSWAWIVGTVLVYFLSFGPALRFSAQSALVPVPRARGGTAMVQGVTYPNWVGICYAPAFALTGHDLRPEYRKHDLLNTYKRYLQWWNPY